MTSASQVLVLGATGGCGAHALLSLLERGVAVKAIVRSASRLPDRAKGHKLLTAIEMPEGHLALDVSAMAEHIRGCGAVISCLGHTLSFKGIYGHPKRLCKDSIKLICDAACTLQPSEPLKLIVVSTEGVDQPGGTDPPRASFMERLVLWLLSTRLLPPHQDNMATVKYLHEEVRGDHNLHVSFCAVRPSNLIDADEPSEYTCHASLQNGIFNSRTTTRANVGCFMADLVTRAEVWTKWKEQMPHLLDVQPMVQPPTPP